MAWPCSRTLWISIVILPSGLVMNSTWRLFLALILLGTQGLPNHMAQAAGLPARQLWHSLQSPLLPLAALKVDRLLCHPVYRLKWYSQVWNMLPVKLKEAYQVLDFLLCGGKAKSQKYIFYFGGEGMSQHAPGHWTPKKSHTSESSQGFSPTLWNTCVTEVSKVLVTSGSVAPISMLSSISNQSRSLGMTLYQEWEH